MQNTTTQSTVLKTILSCFFALVTTGLVLSYAVLVSEATNEMVVCETSCLHEGVNNRWTNTAKASANKVFANQLGFGSLHRDLACVPELALSSLLVNEVPYVFVKRSKFYYYLDFTKKKNHFVKKTHKLYMIITFTIDVEITLRTWFAFSRIDRSFCCDSNGVVATSGDVIFLLVSSDIATGSKSMKTCLYR